MTGRGGWPGCQNVCGLVLVPQEAVVLRRSAPGLVLAAVLLAGCAPAGPASSGPEVPVATGPSPVCTPEAGGSPYPCDQAAYAKMREREALYLAGEELIRKYVAAVAEQQHDIQKATVTPELAAMVAPEYLPILKETLDVWRSSDNSWTGEPKIVTISRRPGIARAGSTVAMAACLDGRGESSSWTGKNRSTRRSGRSGPST